jgi:hypothetical protein
MGDRLAPIDFGDRKVLQIAVPGYSTCALLDSNELVCWGDDDYGESATPARNGGTFGNNPLTVPGKLEASVLF